MGRPPDQRSIQRNGARGLAPCYSGSRLVVLLATMLAACDSSPQLLRSPASPAPQPTPAPGPVLHTLSGVVTADGRPAVGARVVVLEIEPAPSATTDTDGRYRIPGLPTSSIWGRTLVRYSQPGYFTEFKRPGISGDVQLDVAMAPLVFIELGKVTRRTGPDGTERCAGKDYEEGGCERFAVIAPAAGTLEVTLTSTAHSLDIVNPEGEAFAEFSDSPKRLSIPARAGGTYEIRVLTDTGAAAEFELIASLR